MALTRETRSGEIGDWVYETVDWRSIGDLLVQMVRVEEWVRGWREDRALLSRMFACHEMYLLSFAVLWKSHHEID
jgi:hypothetical protein